MFDYRVIGSILESLPFSAVCCRERRTGRSPFMIRKCPQSTSRMAQRCTSLSSRSTSKFLESTPSRCELLELRRLEMEMRQSRGCHVLCRLYHIPIFGKSRLELHYVDWNQGRKRNPSNVAIVDCLREHLFDCFGAFCHVRYLVPSTGLIPRLCSFNPLVEDDL